MKTKTEIEEYIKELKADQKRWEKELHENNGDQDEELILEIQIETLEWILG